MCELAVQGSSNRKLTGLSSISIKRTRAAQGSGKIEDTESRILSLKRTGTCLVALCFDCNESFVVRTCADTKKALLCLRIVVVGSV